MKPFLILALFVLFFSGSCRKEEPSKLELPPYTQQGKNVFACKINGEVFIAEEIADRFMLNPKGVTFSLYRDSIIIISATEELPEKADIGLNFIYNIGQSSILKSGQWTSAYIYIPVVNRQLAEIEYFTNSAHIGTIEIKYFKNNIIAGTFAFDATDGNGDIVHITEGRFDISIPQ